MTAPNLTQRHLNFDFQTSLFSPSLIHLFLPAGLKLYQSVICFPLLPVRKTFHFSKCEATKLGASQTTSDTLALRQSLQTALTQIRCSLANTRATRPSLRLRWVSIVRSGPRPTPRGRSQSAGGAAGWLNGLRPAVAMVTGTALLFGGGGEASIARCSVWVAAQPGGELQEREWKGRKALTSEQRAGGTRGESPSLTPILSPTQWV